MVCPELALFASTVGGDGGVLGLSTIVLEVTPDEHIANEQAVAALARAQDVFQRGRKLVRILHGEDKKDGIQRPSDSPSITLVQEAYLRDLLSASAKFFKIIKTEDGDIKQYISPPVWCVKAVHAYEHWKGIRHLEGISERIPFDSVIVGLHLHLRQASTGETIDKEGLAKYIALIV